MSSTGRGAASLPSPFVPSPPFDLRAAKSRRISAESAPGLTPIRLVSQLFDKTRPLGRLPRRALRVPSQLTASWTSSAGSLRNESLLHQSSTRGPASGHRANQAARVLRETAESPLARSAPLGSRRPLARTHCPRALKPSPATRLSNSERRCLHRKRGRTVSQGRLLIVELWASQAPGSHGSQLERTAC